MTKLTEVFKELSGYPLKEWAASFKVDDAKKPSRWTLRHPDIHFFYVIETNFGSDEPYQVFLHKSDFAYDIGLKGLPEETFKKIERAKEYTYDSLRDLVKRTPMGGYSQWDKEEHEEEMLRRANI